MTARWLAVAGYKNAGKTTLIERLLPVLTADGLAVGVVKHDAHGFVPWPPGTDTARVDAAGAARTVIAGPAGYVSRAAHARPEELARVLAEFASLDLVILEGGKRAPCPRVVMLRDAGLHTDIWPAPDFAGTAEIKNVLAWIVPRPPLAVAGADRPVYVRDDVDGLAACVVSWCRGSPDGGMPFLDRLADYLLKTNLPVGSDDSG